jgi:hypothetical protein
MTVSFWIATGLTTPLVYEVEEELTLDVVTYLNTTCVLSLEPTLTWTQFSNEVSNPNGLVTSQLRLFLFNPGNSPASQLSNLNIQLEKGTQLGVASAGGSSLGLVQLSLLPPFQLNVASILSS